MLCYVEGAQIDNNTMEAALKLVVRNRKNASFYKTQAGASIGDVIMSMIATCAQSGVNVFESGAILLYLAEKFDAFLPTKTKERAETMNWLFWLHGSAPYLGGGFGHFYAYAPEKYEYPINRFAMEAKRQLDVLDRNLAKRQYLAGNNYSIADIATAPWYGALVKGLLYNAAEFLDVSSYKNVTRWADEIYARPAFQRGRMVNRTHGLESQKLEERHNASDFEKLDFPIT